MPQGETFLNVSGGTASMSLTGDGLGDTYDLAAAAGIVATDTVTSFRAGAGGDVLDLSALPVLPTDGSNPFTTGAMRLVQIGSATAVQYNAASPAFVPGGRVWTVAFTDNSGTGLSGLGTITLSGPVPETGSAVLTGADIVSLDFSINGQDFTLAQGTGDAAVSFQDGVLTGLYYLGTQGDTALSINGTGFSYFGDAGAQASGAVTGTAEGTVYTLSLASDPGGSVAGATGSITLAGAVPATGDAVFTGAQIQSLSIRIDGQSYSLADTAGDTIATFHNGALVGLGYLGVKADGSGALSISDLGFSYFAASGDSATGAVSASLAEAIPSVFALSLAGDPGSSFGAAAGSITVAGPVPATGDAVYTGAQILGLSIQIDGQSYSLADTTGDTIATFHDGTLVSLFYLGVKADGSGGLSIANLGFSFFAATGDAATGAVSATPAVSVPSVFTLALASDAGSSVGAAIGRIVVAGAVPAAGDAVFTGSQILDLSIEIDGQSFSLADTGGDTIATFHNGVLVGLGYLGVKADGSFGLSIASLGFSYFAASGDSATGTVSATSGDWVTAALLSNTQASQLTSANFVQGYDPHATPPAVAVINTTTPIVLADAHVVTTGTAPNDQAALSISNTGSSVLAASVGASTGQAYGAGSISGLAAAATDTSSLAVGVDNSTAGAKSGTVALSFTSIGEGSGTPLNLVQNGGFEQGNTGWTLTGGGTFAASSGSYALPAYAGSELLVFGAVGADTSASQTLSTIAGHVYRIQFWYDSSGRYPSDLNVYFGGTDVVSLTNAVPAGWNEYTATATAASTSTLLKLAGRNDPSWDGLDNVSVVDLTESIGATVLPSQTIAVSGNVYRLATASLTGPGSVIAHVGDGGGTGTVAITVTNTASADGYSEGLDASIGTIAATGDIAAGSSGTLNVAYSTATAGYALSGETVTLTSDGTGIDSLGTTSLGATSVNAFVTVNNYATAVLQNAGTIGTLSQSGSIATFNLGTFGVGAGAGLIAASLNVTDTAGYYSDTLTGNLSATGDAALSDVGLGAFSLWPTGFVVSHGFTIDLSTANAGVFHQTIVLAATGSNSSGYSAALPGQTINVTGTVLAAASLAQPVINNGTTIVLPDVHYGSTDRTTLSITNAGQDTLNAAILTASSFANGYAFGTGSISQLGTGATDATSLSVGLNDYFTTGHQSGTVTLGFSSGTGQVPLPSQTVSVSGDFYQLAAPRISLSATSPLVFHAGQGTAFSGTVTVANTATANGYAEALDVSVLNSSGVTTQGSVTQLAAGGTSTAISYTGTAPLAAGYTGWSISLAQTSDGTGIDSLGTTSLGSTSVLQSITVYNYATATVQNFGTVGRLTQSGSIETFDLGTFSVGAGAGVIAASLDVANTATGPADWLIGSLTATGDAALTDIGLGTLGTLYASNSHGFTIDLSTAHAGVFHQTITLQATGANSSGYSGALAGQTINVTGTVLSASSLAQPVINSGTSILLGDAHVSISRTDQTALSISNVGQDTLSASVVSATGSAYGTGTISQLGTGATDATSLVVGLNTATAGRQSGTVTLGFASGTGLTALPQQSVAVSGNVYRLAAPSFSAPEFARHVGDAGYAGTLMVRNTASADGYSESLDVTASAYGASASGAQGSIARLSAGASNSSAISFFGSTPSTAGIYSGGLAVHATSDGTGIDSLGTTDLGTTDVGVTVWVNNYATAEFGQTAGAGSLRQTGTIATLDLGTLIAGAGTASASLDLANIAPTLYSDWLTGQLSALGSAAFSNSGLGSTGTILAGSSDAFSVGLSTAQAGTYSETIVFSGTDANANANGYASAAASQTLVVTGTVIAAAQAQLNTPGPIAFGNIRQGGTEIAPLSVSNIAPTGSAPLTIYSGGASGGGYLLGDVTNLAPGATDSTSLRIGLDTSAAGARSGAVYLNLQSQGSSLSYLGSDTVDVSGSVYRVAQPSLTAPATVYLHAFGSATVSIAAANGAPADGYSETLVASLGNGPSVRLAAGQSSSTALGVSIVAGAVGVYTAEVPIVLSSDGTGIDGLGVAALGTQDVAVTYDVDNYATAELAQTGGAGTLKPTGVTGVYTIDLGSAYQYSTGLTAYLEALNAAQGPAADTLGGQFSASGDSVFSNGGMGGFGGIGFGQADTAPSVTLSTSTIGTFHEKIVLNPTGANPSGFSQSLAAQTIEVVGTIDAAPPPPPPPLPSATAWGDVHITTFDGLFYDFQAEGEFVLAQSDVHGFNVQARLEPWTQGSTVSVITMLAAQIGADRVTFGIGRDATVWIDGRPRSFAQNGSVISLAAGSITQLTQASWQVAWSTGESMTVTNAGSYINTTLTLAASDAPGTVRGLFGSDTGTANDFQLANGTVLAQPMDSSTLYGAYANAWRVSQGTSLMDYLAGQTTATYTDVHFPADAVTVSSLPDAITQVAKQQVIQAGITDPNLQAAAVIDLLVTGDPTALLHDINVGQTTQVTQAAIISTPQAPVPALGVTQVASHLVENATGTTTVTFTAYLTSAAGNDTVIDWAVTAPDASFLGSTAFGGTLPSGYVVVPAGQTSANFTVTLPAGALGAQPSSNLQVTISSTNGDPVFGHTAQTEIDNGQPTAGNPALPQLSLLQGAGIFGGANNVFTLNLGTLVVGQGALQSYLQLSNVALAPSDLLGGTFAVSGSGFTNYGTQQLNPLSAQASFQGLVIATDASTVGAHSETITFTPVDENVTGYSAALAPITLKVTDTVVAAAAARLNSPATIDLGTFYQGDVATTALSVSNVAPAGSANLDAGIGGRTGNATAAGTFASLAPGGTNTGSLFAGIDTSSSGVKSGTVTLNYVSDAGSGNTAPDGASQVTVTGTVYGPAQAYLLDNPITVHQGDNGGTATGTILVRNTAPTNGYSEKLIASVAAFGPYLTGAAGSIALAPGAADETALTTTFSDTLLGTYTGNVAVRLQSDGTGIDGHGITTLGTAYVQAVINVDQYAVAAIEELSGNGTLTPSGVAQSYTLNLGSAAQYSTPLGANLGVYNDVLGTADDLAGSFVVNGAPEFLNTGFGAFQGLSAQQVNSNPIVVLSTGTVGVFTETVTLDPTGYNASGYSGVLNPETVTITGTVVAAPKPVQPGRVGDAWGDVHLTTFDGLYYDFQAAGEFVLTRSTVAGDSFAIQARMAAFGGSSSVSVNTEIAAAVGADRVTFAAGRSDVVWIDGAAVDLSGSPVVNLAAGTLEQTSSSTYRLVWKSGEELDVTDNGSYLNATIALTGADAGHVQGLLGNDGGNAANDLALPDGTALGVSTSYAELYGQYANGWRVSDAGSLMDYGPGQNTASFTDVNFPYNQIGLGNLPANAVALARAAAEAAGITDPNLLQAAIIDYLYTGNPAALQASVNVQQQTGTSNTTGTTVTAPPAPAANVGVSANRASVVESTSGLQAIGFTVFLTSAETADTTIDYRVQSPGPGYLTAADFGGTLPSGRVTIAAGQTSATFTVTLAANVLGAAAAAALQVVIAPEGGETVFAPLAQTEITNATPTQGNPAQPLIEQISGNGSLSGGGTSYVLNLGTVEQFANPLLATWGVVNNGVVPADLLSGSFTLNGAAPFENSGLAPFTPIGAGAADKAPVVELLTSAVGTFTETVVLTPTDSNGTGFSGSLAPVTLEVTGTVTAPPPPPAPVLPVATAWGDVHLTTFDGLYYDFQGAGEFVLARSILPGDSFQVQGRLQPWGSGSPVSVLTQIAAAVGSDALTFSLDGTVTRNGTAISIASGTTLSLAAGAVTHVAGGGYRVNWAGGESMTVSLNGSYINTSIALAASDSGAVQGLLGPDNGNPSADLQLPDGTVLSQPVTSTLLYGAYANAWRVTDASSLFHYAAGETTATFTNSLFPADALALSSLPPGVVAAAEALVRAAGITDPNLINAAIIDLLVTGDPNAVLGSANVQQQGVNLTGVGVSNPPPLPDVGIVADDASIAESTTSTITVPYTIYLTAAEAQASTITWRVTDPGPGYLGLADIVGGSGSGSVQIAAGKTSAQIAVAVLAGALGSQPRAALQVSITPQNGEPVIGTSAQTEIVNPTPQAGPAPVPLIEQLAGSGRLTETNGAYVLDLGTAQQNGAALYANLAVANIAGSPADDLSGLFTITNFTGYLNTGFDPFTGLAAGTDDGKPVVRLNTGTIGVYTETVVLTPQDTNRSGYSATMNDVTLTVTGTIVPMPLPPPPSVPTGTAWGDVHFTTFDGLYYDFQAVGEFTLAKSTLANDSFDVQIRTEQWSPRSTVSVIDEVAASIGSHRVTFGLGRSNTVWLDGVAQSFSGSNTITLNAGTIDGGTIEQTSASTYVVDWNTGESLTVTIGSSYINTTLALARTDGPGSVQGLLGADTGTANDFQLANGTVLAQPITTAQLYGEYANAWRLTQNSSLLDYGPGQTTASFTDLAFPSDALTYASLPTALQQQGLEAAVQAGITDPNLQQAAALDFITTGDPAIVVGGQNVQQQGIVTSNAGVTPASVTPAIGVAANNAAVTEPATGNLAVGYTVYLTQAVAQATTIDWTAAAPDASFLGAAAFGGTLPSGSVVIAAGQTSASFTVAVPGTALGSLPRAKLQVGVTPPTGFSSFAPDAQTSIVNNTVEAGAAAVPLIALLSNTGVLTQVGNGYTLDLGRQTLGQSEQSLSFAIENAAGVTGNDLAGTLAAPSATGFIASGTGPLPVIAAGASYQGLHVAVDSTVIGSHSQTITFTPTSQNPSGYAATLAPLTLTILDSVAQGYAPATFQLNTPTSLTLANQRVGATGLTQALSITNAGTAPAQGLDVGVGGLVGSATGSGTIALLAAGATDSTSIRVGLSTAQAGTITGTVTLAAASDGYGTTGTGQVSVGTATITVGGAVYRTAAPALLAPASFITHVGQTTTAAIGVANTDPVDGYSEALIAHAVGASAGLTATGSTGLITASGSTSLAVTVSTATTGTITGHVTLDLISDGTGIDNLGTVDLGLRTIDVTGTVQNYATATLAQVAGGGTLTHSGTAWTLDFGTLMQGAASLTAELGVRNSATGPADQLSGSFAAGTVPAAFTEALSGFSGLNAGQATTGETVTFATGQAGSFSQTITLNAAGSNASGYSGALAAQTLTIIGTVLSRYVLTTGVDTIAGTGADTITATTDTLTAGDHIDGGPGANTLDLVGGGTFNLALPATLADVQTILAQEGQGASAQIVTLRAGLDATVDVAVDPNIADTAPGITILGAANHDRIVLGTGTDRVTLGVGETLDATAGTAIVTVNAASIADAISGSTGHTTLLVSGGGTAVMGSNIAGITAIDLLQATKLTVNATPGLTVSGTATQLGGSVLSGLGVGDGLDITNLAPAGATLTAITLAGSGTTLRLSDGTATTQVTLAGALPPEGLALSSDGHGGTLASLTAAAGPATGQVTGVLLSGTGGLSGGQVNVGGTLSVGRGGVASFTAINGGGTALVTSGGTAEALTLSGGGMWMFGGSAVATVLSSGGIDHVSSGAVASATVARRGGQELVYAGGVTVADTIEAGGAEILLSGGAASGTVVSSGGGIWMYAATTLSGAVLDSAGANHVSSGATASATTVNAFGQEIVYAGGVTVADTVQSGGGETVLSGGTASGTNVASGGGLWVNGGTAAGAVVQSGGGVWLQQAGALAVATQLAGGTDHVSAGTTASLTTVSAGGQELVYAGGVTVGDTIDAGGAEIVLSGGTASGTVVSSGGGIWLYGGGVVSGAVLSAGAVDHVSSGAVASANTVSAGGQELVYSGGVTLGDTIDAGGSEILLSGGSASGTVVSSGGGIWMYAGTTLSGAVLDSGAVDHVSSGAVASSTTVNAGGQEIVYAGGVTVGDIIHSGGGETVLSGGTASGTMVASGGGLWVNGGTVVNAVTVQSGGGLWLQQQGALASGTQLSGGTDHVSAGTTASNTMVGSGGQEIVYAGGVTVGDVIAAGGAEIVLSGGTASGTVVSSGGGIWLYAFGSLTGAVLSSGAVDHVSSGAMASATVVSAGGQELVYSGGATLGDVIKAGGAEILLAGGTASATVVSSGGGIWLYSGAILSGAVLSSGAADHLAAGSIASATTVTNGGQAFVSSGALTVADTITSGGREYVALGGTASALIVGSQAAAFISSGATLSGGLISGGTLTLAAGAQATNLAFNAPGGTLTLADPVGLATPISGFAATDTIDLLGWAYNSATVITVTTGIATTSVTLTRGASTAQIILNGSYPSAGLHLGHDTAGGTLVTLG